MPSLNVPRLLGLPQSANGHALAYLLVASLILVVVQFGLTSPSIGTWQGFILFSMGPPLLIHHLGIFWLLYKQRDRTANSVHVPDCLTRNLNIVFLVVLHLVWIAGTVLGFLILPLVIDGPWDGGRRKALAWSSAAFGLSECLVLGAIWAFCLRAKREKSAADVDALIHQQRQAGNHYV
ncbi:hypothetical protein FRC12_010644 [Ceratobasidium sp. 428]|nr:hypothetical protein FRC12_010644 [Ceratobasidium sp. 428]